MPTAKELLAEQNKKQQASKPLTGESPESAEVAAIDAETAKIRANIAKRDAEWELAAKSAGFTSVEDYKKALDQLKKDQSEWIQKKALETSELEGNKAQFSKDKEQLRRAYEEVKAREAKVSERESVCKAREDTLGAAQKVEFDREAEYKSDLQVVKRQFNFLRNRLVRICNQLAGLGDYYAETLADNIDLIDRQAGADNSLIEETFAKLLPNLQVITDDTYNAMTRLMSVKRPPDCRVMVAAFRELAASEIWRLVKPERWVND